MIPNIVSALSAFGSATRLYELSIGNQNDAGLLVEAFAADEQLQAIGDGKSPLDQSV